MSDAATAAVWRGLVKALAPVYDLVAHWADRTYLRTADGVWLEQHARDRGTYLQAGESNGGLQARLRSPLQCVTVDALLEGVMTLLAAHGLTWTPNLIELRRQGPFLVTHTSPAGTGDSLTLATGEVTLVDAGHTFSGHEVGRTITIAGATNAGNNGTFPVTAVLGNTSLRFTNASGVTETSAFTWKLDATYDGRADAYCDRGYRVGGQVIIIILPAGASAAIVAEVRELVRQRKAAGVVAVIEKTP